MGGADVMNVTLLDKMAEWCGKNDAFFESLVRQITLIQRQLSVNLEDLDALIVDGVEIHQS